MYPDTKQRRTAQEREAARIRQRLWRTRHPRIDYHPSEEALQIIRMQVGPGVGNDRSSIINTAVIAWAKQRE